MRRYAILAPGLFTSRSAKTAHGAIAYGRDTTVAVIDPDHAGRRVREVVPYLDCDAPLVASVDAALAYEPTALLIGVAPPGGALPAAWRAWILRAIEARLEIVSGLHQFLADDAEFVSAARRAGTTIWDVRAPPPPRLFTGAANAVTARVALRRQRCRRRQDDGRTRTHARGDAPRRARTLRRDGTDGHRHQGNGTAIDRVIADFASGAAEELVLGGAAQAELLFVEGQGGITNAAFAPVTLALLYGCAPDALVLVHLVTRTHVEGFGTPLLGLRGLVELYESLARAVKPAKVVGVALNTHGLDAAQARQAIDDARRETGLPCDDVVRNGADALYDAIAPRLGAKTLALR